MTFSITELDFSKEETYVAIAALMYEHFNEVTVGDSTTLKPDWESYKLLQDNNRLVAFGGYYEDILVGYVILLIINPLHYKDSIVAVSDTIFVAKDFRNSSLGLRFIKEAELSAKLKGATKVNWYTKEDSNLYKLFKKKKKYQVRDIVLTKGL